MPDSSRADTSLSIRVGSDRWARVYDHDANPLPALEDHALGYLSTPRRCRAARCPGLRLPAARLGRHFRLVPSVATLQEEIKAMTGRQLAGFLAAAQGDDLRWYPLWLCLARAGLRLGEALALEWSDLDFAERELRVARALSDGAAGTPKSGHGRTVDMSKALVAVLQALKTERKAETLRRGWPQVPALVFCSEVGTPLQVANVRRAFARSLKRAKLPEHFTPHSLRHTFASLLLQQGGEPGLRPAPARPRLDQAHRGHLRPVAPVGKQGRRRPAPRPKW